MGGYDGAIGLLHYNRDTGPAQVGGRHGQARCPLRLGDTEEPTVKDLGVGRWAEAGRVRDMLRAAGDVPGFAPVDFLSHRRRALELVRLGRAGLFLDIDGTLAPIVADPQAAAISLPVRRALASLAQRMPVVVASGRSARDAHRMVGIDTVSYFGNHGLEHWEHGSVTVLPEAEGFAGQMARLARSLRLRVRSLEGVSVEDKGATLSVHYRQAPDTEVARQAVLELVAGAWEAQGLRCREGKMVVEVRPPVDVDKGGALRTAVQRWHLRSVLVFGDDRTDVDAFRVAHELARDDGLHALAVAIVGMHAPADVLLAADYHLQDVGAMETFLIWLARQRPDAVERGRRGC